MKQILMCELKVGDIYCLNLRNRESFQVTEIYKSNKILTTSRQTGKKAIKEIKGYVMLLKRPI